jgi:RimJ/RimL family protein N-acetyltransferase
VLEGTRIRLRPVGEEDLARLVEWRNAPGVREQFFNKQPLRLDGQRDWFATYREDPSRELFVILQRPGDLPVGTVGLSRIDRENRSAEFGNLLIADAACRGKGFAREATELLIRDCFERRRLHRLYLYVYADNERAAGLYERCGFLREGRLRDADLRDGVFRDILVMGLLCPEANGLSGGEA